MHFFYRIWDCDTCIRDVKLVAEVYTSLDAIIEWIGIFQGLIFQRNFLQFYLLRSLIVVYARLAIISKKVNLHVCWDLHIYEI